MCYSSYDPSMMMRDQHERVAGVNPATIRLPKLRLAGAFAKIKVAVAGLLAASILSSCAGTPAASVARLEGAADDGKISVRFNNFAEGTRCIMQTPRGQLVVEKMPGEFEYPAAYRNAPITCTEPSGAVYAVDVDSSLPETFRVAAATAYSTGELIVTISTDQALLQAQSEDAVRRLN